MKHAIAVRELTRTYTGRTRTSLFRSSEKKSSTALHCIDLEIEPGEVRGILGPNGAGKSTLIKILSTVLLPTSGQARVLGRDVTTDAAAVRRRIGIVFGGERGLYGRLTARENLDYWAALYGLPKRVREARIGELLERIGLGEHADTPADHMSRGMKQRLHLARGLVGDPEVIFLDEPTVGMDPVAAREFRTLVGDLHRDGRTILITTHDMREAEAVCDRITLIDRGRVVGTASPDTVGQWITAFERVEAQHVPAELREKIGLLNGVASIDTHPNDWIQINTDSPGAIRPVLELLVASGVTMIRTSLPSLEDVYVAVVGDRGLSV
ncbi:ABC transporter ATP-binding protein [Streptomyces sp. NBC_01591]|uniref:ABC transporter ATP-binding protein n=1 Tax=Streptomyces sp. NBC_01591 TaxID=2975888 RepID=UPI002DDB41DB|nr:ABC transporter ATP-binding protein [Streptomyces sp. NBC_01591]WSD71859.1 ABC transporter ATP-binding protein [Streptomyces sp. NBC_01591]